LRRPACPSAASRYTTWLRTGVRAAEGAALEMPCTVFPYRGFESHPVRFSSATRTPTDNQVRAVAQLGSAPYWGCGGRRFKSCQPDSKAPLEASFRGAFFVGLRPGCAGPGRLRRPQSSDLASLGSNPVSPIEQGRPKGRPCSIRAGEQWSRRTGDSVPRIHRGATRTRSTDPLRSPAHLLS
jgi:hypothetical protein